MWLQKLTLLHELKEARKVVVWARDRPSLAEFDARFARYHRNVDSTFRLLSEDSVRAGEAAKFVNSSEFMVSVNRADDALKRLSLNKEAAAEVSAQALQQLFDESRADYGFRWWMAFSSVLYLAM